MLCTADDYKTFTGAYDKTQACAIKRVPAEGRRDVFGSPKKVVKMPEDHVVQGGRDLIAKDIYRTNIVEEPPVRRQEKIVPPTEKSTHPVVSLIVSRLALPTILRF